MASYNELLALIDAYINQNGVQAITGQVLNGVLRAMVDQLGRGYTIMGTAVPSTDPGTPDGPESWFASTPGTYTDMGGLTVANAELALLSYTPSDGWAKTTLTQGIVSTSASVNNQVGTPSVTSSYVDGVLTFTFENLKGNTGDPAGFGAVTASVDSNIGTPSVQVQTSGPDTAKAMSFQFHNLKGETGVTSVVATVDNTTGNPTCAVSLVGQELHLDFTGLKGVQGDTGVSADYPITIANNLTTNDPTSALSAAMGVQLESEISQLDLKVDELEDIKGQTITVVTSKNLLDPSACVLGYINMNTGAVGSTSDRYVSDYIPVSENGLYCEAYNGYGAAGRAAVYNAQKQYIRGFESKTYTYVSGDAFVRWTLDKTKVETPTAYCVEDNQTHEYTPYFAPQYYVNRLAEKAVKTANIDDDAVTENKVADDAISIDKIKFKTVVFSENRANPAECEYGYIDKDTGAFVALSADKNKYATGFIAVSENGLYCNGANGYGNAGRNAVYDANKQYLRGFEGLVYTYQAGDAFVRWTVSKLTLEPEVYLYVIEGTSAGTYTPYKPTTYNLDKDIVLSNTLPAISLCGFDSGVVKKDSIAGNGNIQVSAFPQYLKANGVVSFRANLTSFDEIFVGFGDGSTNSIQAKIDGTNLSIYKSGSLFFNSGVYAHGLTISDFIIVTFDNDFFTPKITIATKSGLFVKAFESSFPSLESYGKPTAIMGDGTAVTDAEIRATSDKFRKPIWVVGDSYVSLYQERWPYQMIKTIGVDDFLILGLAGGGSTGMFRVLYEALYYGTPKYLLWCLGMNDVATNWEDKFNKLKEICAENGTELILQTIPIPDLETKDEQVAINAIIKASGYRYIDACAAMSPDNSSTWYEGFCADGVHTTVLGAKVLAAQFLADFPEFMQ